MPENRNALYKIASPEPFNVQFSVFLYTVQGKCDKFPLLYGVMYLSRRYSFLKMCIGFHMLYKQLKFIELF